MTVTFDLSLPISNIMTTKLVTVNPKDNLFAVKEIFSNNRIHHIPVVRYTNLEGMISYSDFLHFTRGIHRSKYDEMLEETRLKNYTADEIMEKEICKLDPDDSINVAIEIFLENFFHAIPITKGNELKGIITPLDILKQLTKDQ